MGLRYEFVAKEMTLSVPALIKINWNAFWGRKVFFRRFCAESGIDLPLNLRKKIILPEKYLAKDDPMVTLIGAIRDKAIVAAYADYYDRYLNLKDYLARLENEIEAQDKYIRTEDDRRRDIVAKLSKEKDPSQRIFFESRRHELEVRVENQKSKLADMKTTYKQMKRLESQNAATWKHQVTLIENYISESIKKYLKNVGKKVIRKLDYGDFTYINPRYSDDAKEILGDL